MEKYYNEIINLLNSLSPESILNLGALRNRVELLYKKIDLYFHKSKDMATISTMEWQDIIELQKSFFAIWKWYETYVRLIGKNVISINCDYIMIVVTILFLTLIHIFYKYTFAAYPLTTMIMPKGQINYRSI